MSVKPAVMIGVDTEADDQWSDEGRRSLSVRNAERLPGLQELCDRFGARPTYLVTWEMATLEPSASILRDLGRTGRAEIGTHLHPWTSPPFRPEDLAAHTYPHNLPDELLERQITELTGVIEERLGTRPTTYRAGRNGFDGRTLPILERLRYTVDTSVDPLFNETRKRGMSFAGAPREPYHPGYRDVRRSGASPILEIPITSATVPALPKRLESMYTSLKPIPWRGALKRLGLRAAWLRPSYTPRADMLAFATRLQAEGATSFNIIFHSSELLPGGSPYTPDQPSVDRFLDDLRALLDHLTGTLGVVGRTYAEFARDWHAGRATA